MDSNPTYFVSLTLSFCLKTLNYRNRSTMDGLTKVSRLVGHQYVLENWKEIFCGTAQIDQILVEVLFEVR